MSGKSVRKCRVEGFGRAESALMQTLRSWHRTRTHKHTHAHTSTRPSCKFCCSNATNIFHIGMSYWGESALGTATPCCAEAITWSNRARLITWTGSGTSYFLFRSSRITGVGPFYYPFMPGTFLRPNPTSKHVQKLHIGAYYHSICPIKHKSTVATGQLAAIHCQYFIVLCFAVCCH